MQATFRAYGEGLATGGASKCAREGNGPARSSTRALSQDSRKIPSEAAAAKTEAGRQNSMGLASYYERIGETIAPPSPPTE